MLANILFAKELARRLREEGSPIHAFSLHPGVIKTPLQRHMGWEAALMNFLGGEGLGAGCWLGAAAVAGGGGGGGGRAAAAAAAGGDGAAHLLLLPPPPLPL